MEGCVGGSLLTPPPPPQLTAVVGVERGGVADKLKSKKTEDTKWPPCRCHGDGRRVSIEAFLPGDSDHSAAEVEVRVEGSSSRFGLTGKSVTSIGTSMSSPPAVSRNEPQPNRLDILGFWPSNISELTTSLKYL